MSGNVKVTLYRIDMYDRKGKGMSEAIAAWATPTMQITTMGSSGRVDLDEEDFCFFAERSGVDSISIDFPDGRVRYKVAIWPTETLIPYEEGPSFDVTPQTEECVEPSVATGYPVHDGKPTTFTDREREAYALIVAELRSRARALEPRLGDFEFTIPLPTKSFLGGRGDQEVLQIAKSPGKDFCVIKDYIEYPGPVKVPDRHYRICIDRDPNGKPTGGWHTIQYGGGNARPGGKVNPTALLEFSLVEK